MLKKTVSYLLALVILASFGLLAACSSGPSIKVYNWEDYIDDEVIKEFTEETGIKVNYTRFTTNEDMYTKLVKGGGNYDVVFPSDYMIERLVAEDELLTLDYSKLPNAVNTMEHLQNPAYDPGGAYSVAYMWGTVGILYNETMTGGPITSWASMWDDQFKDNVLMMDSIRDTLGITLKMLGHSLNTSDEVQLQEAKAALIDQRERGIVMAYGVDDIKDKMENNEAALGLVWSGDALTTMEKNADLRYVVPDEGSNVWVDGMVIPKSSKNVDGAHAFINFLLRADIAARNSEYIGYSTPNAPALDILGDDYIDDETFNPPQDVIDRCEFLHDLKADGLALYNRMWLEIKK